MIKLTSKVPNYKNLSSLGHTKYKECGTHISVRHRSYEPVSVDTFSRRRRKKKQPNKQLVETKPFSKWRERERERGRERERERESEGLINKKKKKK